MGFKKNLPSNKVKIFITLPLYNFVTQKISIFAPWKQIDRKK
jgi:hypothetical protein